MELYGQQSSSVPQKVVIHLIEALLLWLSFWILFQEGGAWIAGKLATPNAEEQVDRRILIFTFNIVTFARLGYMMIVLLKRRIPWEESVSVPFAFALYYIGFSLLVLPTAKPLDTLDFFAIALFIVGSVLNSGGEILRDRWKKNPENKGKIYTGGFFKYSRHINYFGDILWVIAYAVATRNAYAALVPVFLFCFFAFYNAPKLDKYLKAKYGSDYDRYASKTKMLIPFIY
ncbi:hypothetical protein GCM10007415_39650 [Parapedobacter pyrenivorans]|uniref:Steroid 5-alpha reductase C-terminal domain-containing protein n=1 Tax=Parapedobacter pyrenivorans TaxID=1305674 RepID=A0A917HZL1_9SPHI|nr:DUF1295 domain-containing protein [Parapedobacter pyrenivorans]GGG99879.1 hypothetical protein GCM10007415_39650 [Parapedobacter pyrenivorans]